MTCEIVDYFEESNWCEDKTTVRNLGQGRQIGILNFKNEAHDFRWEISPIRTLKKGRGKLIIGAYETKDYSQNGHMIENRIPIDKVRRIKPTVLTMISSGIRSGSWGYLKWQHIIPITNKSVIIGAKLIVKNTKINNREYITFITPEAYKSIKDWMNFRQLDGKEINGDSWLMRDAWQKIDRAHGHRIGL